MERIVVRSARLILPAAVLAMTLTACALVPESEKSDRPNSSSANVEQARAHFDGDGRPVNAERGVQILRPEAEAGNAEAQFLLGLAYRDGRGVAKDLTQALRLFERASAQGHPDASYLAGLAHFRGRGAVANGNLAFWFMTRAANTGHAAAEYHLGLFHQTGTGTAKDPAAALPWFRKAADQGFPEAAEALGFVYANGIGAEKEPLWGLRWSERAARYGLPYAQYRTGAILAAGKLLPADRKTGLVYLLLARKAGTDGAERLVAALETRMTDADISGARSIAGNWRPVPAGTVDEDDTATIRFAQAALRRAGINPGPVDGLMGPRTKAAIASFRAREGLGGAGLDRSLLDALRATKRRRSS